MARANDVDIEPTDVNMKPTDTAEYDAGSSHHTTPESMLASKVVPPKSMFASRVMKVARVVGPTIIVKTDDSEKVALPSRAMEAV